jgi:hypothetical protein
MRAVSAQGAARRLVVFVLDGQRYALPLSAVEPLPRAPPLPSG